MEYTNRHNVHEAFGRAIVFDPWRRRGDITVTQLDRPPLMAYLEMIHDDKIVVDIGDRLFALMGQLGHELLQRQPVPNALQEQGLQIELEGWTVTGRPDLWQEEALFDYDIRLTDAGFDFLRRAGAKPIKNALIDFKFTSVWSYLMGDKADWERQLNSYAVLYRAAGFPVDHLIDAAALRDWSARRAKESADYPNAAFMRKEWSMWTDGQAREHMSGRVRLHQAAHAGNPRYCTDEERWAKPDTFAVKKAGQKRAVRVFDTEAQATALVAQKGNGLTIESRKGDKWVRCRDYCDVARFCPQLKEAGVAIGQGKDADVQEPQRS